jgi:hypothetical protein
MRGDLLEETSKRNLALNRSEEGAAFSIRWPAKSCPSDTERKRATKDWEIWEPESPRNEEEVLSNNRILKAFRVAAHGQCFLNEVPALDMSA